LAHKSFVAEFFFGGLVGGFLLAGDRLGAAFESVSVFWFSVGILDCAAGFNLGFCPDNSGLRSYFTLVGPALRG
jgi:hypothetical protein